MGRYILRRLIQAIPILFLLTIFMFALIHLMPGGPEQVFFNPHLTPAARQEMRVRFGLTDSVPIQYVKWLGQTLTGNFGFSYADNLPVSYLLSQRFPNTLQLFIPAFALALILALLLGVISAIRQGSVLDYSLTTVSYFGIRHAGFLAGAAPAIHLWCLAESLANVRHAIIWRPIQSPWHLSRPYTTPHLAGANPVRALYCWLESLYALQHDRGSQTRLYAHCSRKRRWDYFRCIPPCPTQRSDSTHHRGCHRFCSRSGRCDDYRRRLCLAGYGRPILPVARNARLSSPARYFDDRWSACNPVQPGRGCPLWSYGSAYQVLVALLAE